MAFSLCVQGPLNQKETLRYLGMGGCEPDARLTQQLTEAEAQLRSAARPIGWYVRLSRAQAPRALCLDTADISRHLTHCNEFFLLGATLGAGVDTLLRRLSATDVSAACVADALASVMAEAAAAELEKQIRKSLQPGEFVTGRYSPGYGDWPLAAQPELCRLLDSSRRLGVGCSANYLLTPRKSVTALMGISNQPVTGTLAGCGHCVLQETCEYRKRGKTCADL